jgi:hypothetical protein
VHEVLAKLLDAHVAEEASRWQGERLARTLGEYVKMLFHWFSAVKLDDVSTREQIFRVIQRYVIDLRVSGGITELSGETSRLVYASRAAADTRLDQLLSAEMYEEFADKVLALEGVRRTLIELIAQSSTVREISARVIARAVLDLAAVGLAPVRGLAPAALSGWADKLGPALLPPLERLTEAALRKHRELARSDTRQQLIELLDSDGLRSVLDDLWTRVSPMRLSELFAAIEEHDVEDFVVLVYEFWLRYRQTDFFRRVSQDVIDYFFRKYGQTTLLDLIDDMGVSEAMLTEVVVDVFRPLLDEAARSGALEHGIRMQLEAFYGSPAAKAALAAALQP